MSYILDPQTGRPPWRAPLLAVLSLLGLLALASGLYLYGRATTESTPPATPGQGAALSWSVAGPWPVPTSATHGPFRTGGGLAAGFSHDALGAALAAFNITYRLSSDVGPMVYDATARAQTYGDTTATLDAIRAQPAGGSAPPTEFYYRVLTGNPTGDSVLISLAVRSPASTTQGGYLSAQRTLRWQDGDWRLAVPMPPGQLMTTLDGYQSLGGPHV